MRMLLTLLLTLLLLLLLLRAGEVRRKKMFFAFLQLHLEEFTANCVAIHRPDRRDSASWVIIAHKSKPWRWTGEEREKKQEGLHVQTLEEVEVPERTDGPAACCPTSLPA